MTLVFFEVALVDASVFPRVLSMSMALVVFVESFKRIAI
jgi:hypothetical protein